MASKTLNQCFKSSSTIIHQIQPLCIYLQSKRYIDGPPTPSLLKKLQPTDSTQQQHDSTSMNSSISTPSFAQDTDTELFTRTLITPKPFNRYHHLWLHKTLTNEKRIKNLPIPIPNHKKMNILTCIMHHIINNGPSTLESLWKGLRPFGVIKSKRRLKKTIKRYIEKYPDTLPFVNINKAAADNINAKKSGNSEINQDNMESDDETSSDSETGSESENDSDIDSGSESEFPIDSDFSDTDSSLSTDWDSDGLQPSVYGIRAEKKEKLIAKYERKWMEIETQIEDGDIEFYADNTSLWWYSIQEHGKPVAKGPILWDGLIERSKSDKQNKGKLNKNKITNQTPVFNFSLTDHWKLLNDVMKQV